MKLTAEARDLASCGFIRLVCDVGNLFERAPVEVVELQERLVLGRELLYGFVQLLCRGVLRQVVRDVITYVKRQLDLSSVLPQMVERFVIGNALEPRRERCPLRVEVLQVLESRDESVLHYVLGVLLNLDNASDEHHELRSVTLHELAELTCLAAAYALYDDVVVVCHYILYRHKEAKCHAGRKIKKLKK